MLGEAPGLGGLCNKVSGATNGLQLKPWRCLHRFALFGTIVSRVQALYLFYHFVRMNWPEAAALLDKLVDDSFQFLFFSVIEHNKVPLSLFYLAAHSLSQKLAGVFGQCSENIACGQRTVNSHYLLVRTHSGQRLQNSACLFSYSVHPHVEHRSAVPMPKSTQALFLRV